MRIRKHAKISPLLYATSSLQAAALFQTYVCQLNQSPWDVMTFSPPSSPPPPFQANGSDVRAGNASSDRLDSVSQRELSSRWRSEYPNATPKVEAAKEDTAPPAAVENEATILCCKSDGKSRRDTAKDNSLCDNIAQHAAKKPVKAAAEAPRRSRPKKAPAALSANPYAFYYYTGFGPRWGKQRGESSRSNGSSMPKNVQVAAAISEEDFDYSEYEDEDEEDEEESKDNGKKRARKPIKARSLKSLL